MKHLFILFSIGLIILTSCKTKELALVQPTKDNVVITMQRGSCFGSCPVYKITIHEGGYVHFDGVKYTSKLGTYYKKLQAKEYYSLLDAFKEANFPEMPDEYPSEIVDLPTITLGYRVNDGIKLVSGRENRPVKVMTLQYMIEKLVDSEGWMPIDPKSEAEIEREAKPKETIIENEIIVEPVMGKLPSFLKDHDEFGVRLVTKITDEANLWLIEFDRTKIQPKSMLEKVKADERIIRAEFNKKIESRDSRGE